MKRRYAVWMLLLMLAVPLCCGTAAAFSDVPESHWANAEIRYVTERGLFNGKSETSFAPSDGMTRGQMCAVLYRYAGSPAISGTLTYEDVQPGRYYYNGILWARENRVMAESKQSARYFRPDETITRSEFALMLYQYNLYEGGDSYDPSAVSASKMTDMDLCGNAVCNAMLGWACPKGVLRGTTATTMNPNGTLTRAHVAAMLYRYDTMVRETEPDVSPVEIPADSSPGSAETIPNDTKTDAADEYKITIDTPSTMEVRDRIAITPRTIPAQERCSWEVTSGNEAVLGIEKAGDGQTLLVAKSAGTAVVTVTNKADGKSTAATVTVQERSTDNLDLETHMDMRLEIVRLTNELRREKGLNELVVNDALMNAAQEYATAHPINHDIPLSTSLCSKWGYPYSFGENLAWNYDTAYDVFLGWKNSLPHYQTMLRERYDEIGVGVADNGCFSMFLGDRDMMEDWR